MLYFRTGQRQKKCLDFDGLPGHPRSARRWAFDVAVMDRMRQRFRLHSVRSAAAVLLVAVALGACATRNEPPSYAAVPSAEDDDAFCRQGGKVAPGSPDYVYCRKDRDAARNQAVSRADRKQKDLAEWMLNHPN